MIVFWCGVVPPLVYKWLSNGTVGGLCLLSAGTSSAATSLIIGGFLWWELLVKRMDVLCEYIGTLANLVWLPRWACAAASDRTSCVLLAMVVEQKMAAHIPWSVMST